MVPQRTALLGTANRHFTFNTRRPSTAAPFTLAGTPSLDIRVNGSATQATAGLTLTVDFDSRTGENHVEFDQDNGTLALADADETEIFVAAGTVDSISEVGRVVGSYLISDGSLAAGTLADINSEVVDALSTDTYAEPGQGTPSATLSITNKLGYLFKAWRNRHTQTASEYALFNDDGTTKDQEAAVSDNGTTLDRGEVTTGA